MLVVNRFRVTPEEHEEFLVGIRAARDALARQQGYVDGTIGRNVDDPSLWVLRTEWENVGSYRRALSAYEVKAEAWPVLARAIEEPSAYEIVTGDGQDLNRVEPRSLG